MSESHNQSLSALVDDECGDRATSELVDRLIASREFCAEWARYHLISDACAGRLPERIGSELAERTRRAIDREPRPFATPRKAAFLKPVVGLALAASVATVAILGVRAMSNGEVPVGARLAANESPSDTLLAGIRWNVTQPAVEARLNGYLVSHSEQTGHGVGGMLPYARIVGYAPSDE